MKKIIYILMSLMILGTTSFGQDKKADKKETKGKATYAPKSGKTTEAVAPETKPAKVKKDGTPDMRYKENKDAAKPTPKLKKDGTPDMRYKQNKKADKK